MKIVYLGTPEIAVPSLDFFINKDDIEVLAVITQPDRPSGRGHKLTPPPVKVLAEKYNIPVFQPIRIRKDEELIEKLKSLKPDAFIMVAFGQILSQEILDIPRLGTINFHSSLLPKYRGANPIQWAIINGDKTTGITTMLSDAGVDTGPMLIKKEIEITENMTAPELAEIMANIGTQILYDSLVGLDNGSITPTPQPEEGVTFAPKLSKEDGKINWARTSLEIHNQVRGMKPFPSTFTSFRGETVKIHQTRLNPNNKEIVESSRFGEITGIIGDGIEVLTGDGSIIVEILQFPSKKPTNAINWLNGARISKGEKFETL